MIADPRPPANGTIWFVSEHYFPDQTSTGHALTCLAERLAISFHVKAICAHPSSKTNPNVSVLEMRNGVLIHRCAVPNLNKNKILPRIVKATIITIALAIRALTRVKKGDIILSVTNPPPIPLTMAIVCVLKRAQFVILVYDLFPENLVPAGLIKAQSILLPWLIRLMRIPYRLASRIVVIGRDMKEKICEDAPYLSGKIEIITNWAESDEVRPLSKHDNRIIENLGLKERFVVQFAGNLGRVQGLDSVLETMDYIKDEGIHFLFIGNGSRSDAIQHKIANGGTGRVTLMASMSRDIQKCFLNACDVGLVTLAPGMYGLGVPSKTYNIMAAGKPVIAMVDKNSEIGRMVVEEGIGWVVAPGDAVGLAKVIEEARSNGDRLKHMGAQARNLAESKYSFARISEAYAVLFRTMLCACQTKRSSHSADGFGRPRP